MTHPSPAASGDRKCPGCRCVAPTTNRKCGCCGRWPDALPCVYCGGMGRFDTDLLVTTAGPMHDGCWQANAWSKAL